MNAQVPKVFVSYSHDSPDHKRWTAELSAELRRNGIDVILDQWDLKLGEDVTLFMEAGLRVSERVLAVCTDEYVRKANAGEGGVGYERMILTAELVKNIGTNKIVPVVRQSSGEEGVPNFLNTRLYIDFRDEDDYRDRVEELTREIHKVSPADKPPLGENPFATTASDDEKTTQRNAIEIPSQLQDPIQTYELAIALARTDDKLGWRRLIKRIRHPVGASLARWRTKFSSNPPDDVDTLHTAVDEAIAAISPLLAVALAGVESGDDDFKDQRALFDAVYNVDQWERSGRVIIVDLPSALGFTYQALHGAIALETKQLDVALGLAKMKIRGNYGMEYAPIWTTPDVIGWPESLGRDCKNTWKFIEGAVERWSWLEQIFGAEEDFRVALSAYYMALNILELADQIRNKPNVVLEQSDRTRVNVPLGFVSRDETFNQKALSLLISDPKQVASIWESIGVDRKQMEEAWPTWMMACYDWVRNVYHTTTLQIGHGKLFEVLE